MPRTPPRNLVRTYNTRVNGIFKKASELHDIDNDIRIAIFVEKKGHTPWVFSVDEGGPSWPCGAEDFVNKYRPQIKNPSHYLSLNEGISKGRAQIVESSPPPPYLGRQTSLPANEPQDIPEIFDVQASAGNSSYTLSMGSPYHAQTSNGEIPYNLFGQEWSTTPQRMPFALGTLPSKSKKPSNC